MTITLTARRIYSAFDLGFLLSLITTYVRPPLISYAVVLGRRVERPQRRGVAKNTNRDSTEFNPKRSIDFTFARAQRVIFFSFQTNIDISGTAVPL